MLACTYLISQQDQAILLTDTHNRLHLALAQHLACGIPRVDDAQCARVYPTLPRRQYRRFQLIKVNAVPHTAANDLRPSLTCSSDSDQPKQAAGLCIAYPQTPSSESVALYPSCVPPYEVIAALYSGYCGIGIRMPIRRAFRVSQQTGKASEQSSHRRSGLGSPSRARS